jgi:uncharacterized protein YbjT (DUF2867 family)
MYAIAGVTGHTGSVAADALLAQGKPVRVLVRDAAKGAAWKTKGAEVVVGSLGDVAVLTKLFSGAAGAFVLLPPVFTTETPLEDNAKLSAGFAEAIRAAGLPHVVLLSSVGAHHPDGTGPIRALHRAEHDLAATGAAVSFIRASSFQENWATSLGGLAHGVLPTFIPVDLRYPQVATPDIGRAVASALAEGPAANKRRVIELAGPREYSSAEVAAAAAQIIGKPVVAQLGPLDAVVPAFTSFGVTRGGAELYREMFAGVASGRVGFEGGEARLVRGTVEIADTLNALITASRASAGAKH